jgi:hypothetical protein
MLTPHSLVGLQPREDQRSAGSVVPEHFQDPNPCQQDFASRCCEKSLHKQKLLWPRIEGMLETVPWQLWLEEQTQLRIEGMLKIVLWQLRVDKEAQLPIEEMLEPVPWRLWIEEEAWLPIEEILGIALWQLRLEEETQVQIGIEGMMKIVPWQLWVQEETQLRIEGILKIVLWQDLQMLLLAASGQRRMLLCWLPGELQKLLH